MPTVIIMIVINVTGREARLCRNGILLVRITWMMSVCVKRLSTNQPVWNTLALWAAAAGVEVFQQLKT